MRRRIASVGIVIACAGACSLRAQKISGHPSRDLQKVLERCDRLRQNRDAFTIGAGGAGVLAGAGGITTLQFADHSSQLHTAELALAIGTAAAALAAAATASSNAYAEEGCPAWFAKYRGPAEDPMTSPIDGGSGSAAGAGSGSGPGSNGSNGSATP